MKCRTLLSFYQKDKLLLIIQRKIEELISTNFNVTILPSKLLSMEFYSLGSQFKKIINNLNSKKPLSKNDKGFLL